MRLPLLWLAVAVALCAQLALAQTPPTSDPRELSEASRKAYAQGLKDARKYIADKKYPDALAVLDKMATERPREPQVRFLRGVALAESGRTDEAIAVYTSLLADFPELPESHNNLAVLYAQKGNYEGARDELVQALLAAPDYATAYENLGDVYTRLAGMNYDKAIARDPRNRTAPPKLKLVRDVLGMRTPIAPTTSKDAAPASKDAAAPASATPAQKDAAPAAAVPAPSAVPAAAGEAPK